MRQPLWVASGGRSPPERPCRRLRMQAAAVVKMRLASALAYTAIRAKRGATQRTSGESALICVNPRSKFACAILPIQDVRRAQTHQRPKAGQAVLQVGGVRASVS